jgi:hydroxyacylglutathione hydrolase
LKEGKMRVEKICLGELSTNCYLVNADGLTILIDPAEYCEKLTSFIGNRQVDLVINTHGHFDHIGGNWQLQKAGAKLLIHEEDLPLVDSFYPDHPPFDRYIVDGETLPGGFRVIHTPGHSPGSIVLVKDDMLFVGDLLFAGSIGRTDFPGGSITKMNLSLSNIVSLPGDYRIYPGHGPSTTLKRERRINPYLTSLGAST